MDDSIAYDQRLWFLHKGCTGKHYLIGNPHTFRGRMWAWCPVHRRTVFVSKSEIESCSPEAEYWIQGFLAGNEPPPPLDEHGDPAFDSPEYARWEAEIRLFHHTGFWHPAERRCRWCGEVLLRSEPEDACADCRRRHN